MVSPFDLTGQVALVVGAAPAASVGSRVDALTDATARPSRSPTWTAPPHRVDVTDEASVAALFASVIARHGRVDVVVNAAGVMLRKAYDETTLEEFDRVVRVNLTGTWLVDREAGKAMTPRGHRAASSTSPRSTPSASARSRSPPTTPPRPASPTSPAPWPPSSARTASPSTAWPRASSTRPR